MEYATGADGRRRRAGRKQVWLFLQKSEFCQFRLDTGACQPRLTEPAVQQLDQPPASELKRSRSSECEIIAICLATALDGVHW